MSAAELLKLSDALKGRLMPPTDRRACVMNWMKVPPTFSNDGRDRTNGTAITRGDVARLAMWAAAFYVADKWFDIPAVFSIPAAFLGVIVYGYLAVERSTRRKAALMDAAETAWDAVEAAALDLREAESAHASAAVMAEREEAYAAALDRSAIIAKNLADHRSLHGPGERNNR
jgi:hypothetical protein